jgi:hypothetical protein
MIPFAFWKEDGFNPDSIPGLRLWWDFGDPLYTEYATTGNLNVRLIKDKKDPSIQATFAGTDLNRMAKITEGLLPNGAPRFGLGNNTTTRDNIDFPANAYGNLFNNAVAGICMFWAGRYVGYVNNRRWLEVVGDSVTRGYLGQQNSTLARFYDGTQNTEWDYREPTDVATNGVTTRQVYVKQNTAGSPPLLPGTNVNSTVRIGTTNTARLVTQSVIFEVLIYKRSNMTNDERDAIVDYLRAKWNI